MDDTGGWKHWGTLLASKIKIIFTYPKFSFCNPNIRKLNLLPWPA